MFRVKISRGGPFQATRVSLRVFLRRPSSIRPPSPLSADEPSEEAKPSPKPLTPAAEIQATPKHLAPPAGPLTTETPGTTNESPGTAESSTAESTSGTPAGSETDTSEATPQPSLPALPSETLPKRLAPPEKDTPPESPGTSASTSEEEAPAEEELLTAQASEPAVPAFAEERPEELPKKPKGTGLYDTLGSRRDPPEPETVPDPPPAQAPDTTSSTHDEDAAPPSRSWQARFRPLAATAGISILVTAVFMGYLSGSREEPELAGPEPWLQAEIDRHSAETQRLELDRRSRVIAEDDAVIRAALAEILEANLRMEDQSALSIDHALDLDGKLEFFVERYRQIAEGDGLGPEQREAANALVEQGSRYRQALAGVLTVLETESAASGRRAEGLRARLREREIWGREVRIIHDPDRVDDARRVAELLSGVGAEANLVLSEVDSTSRHQGRLFYHGEQAREAARAIADLVSEVEYLQPEAVGLAQPFLSLWLVSDGS